MKIPPGYLCWIIMAILVAGGVIYAVLPSRPDAAAQKAAVETRLALRQQGLKTDLADFDLSTPPELSARETILKAVFPTNRSAAPPFVDHPNLMEIVGTNSAIVVWKEDVLKRQNRSWPDYGDQLTWDELREAVGANAQVDAACAAVISGPTQFNLDAAGGSHMLLPHLAVLKNLTQTLDDRTMLALHDGNLDAAWTNLMAATRLATAWKTEPAEISHLVRFTDAKLLFAATWQALQTNGWTDEQLTRLQQEWESANFFANLPEIAAFQRASAFADSEQQEVMESRLPFGEFVTTASRFPFAIWSELQDRWRQREYLRHGRFDDEKNLLLFYRDREVELRNAIQAPTWTAMRRLPGVTNTSLFQSPFPSQMQARMILRQINQRVQNRGNTLLGRAAETEAERRLIITALALERYHGKNGGYPNSLLALTPDFLKNPLPDFMDGQALRYRLTADGHFLLYSVGQDCVDSGGKIQLRPGDEDYVRPVRLGAPLPEADIVWPLPASMAGVAAMRQKEKRAEELRNLREQDRESEQDWRQSPLRQARVSKILAMNWLADTNMGTFAGRRVVDLVSNEKDSGTNQPSLAQLLAPEQIITGNEPENVTFDVPVNYDVITNMGGLFLLVDADPEEALGDSGGRIQDCNRAGNGDCLLVWHTIFDPPGRHAIQIRLVLSTPRGGEYLLKGPPVSIVTSNLCQFSLASATYDIERGAIFHARLPETNGLYSIECTTTNGEHLKTLTGNATNGEFEVIWNLVDDNGHRLTGETFNSIVHITLPDSGRSQTLKGP